MSSQFDIDMFLMKWQIDGSQVSEMLAALSPEVRHKVMAGFNPKPGTNDVTGLFKCYVRSMGRVGKGISKGSSKILAPVDRVITDAELMQYCQNKGLDVVCLELLSAYTPDVQRQVMIDFHVKPDATDASGLFQSFCKSVGRRMGTEANWSASESGTLSEMGSEQSKIYPAPSQEEMQTFVQLYALVPNVAEALYKQPPEVQRQSMDGFSPPADARDLSSVFMGFMRGVARRIDSYKGGGKGQLTGKWSGPSGGSSFFRPGHGPACMKRPIVLENGTRSSSSEIDEFCLRWGLDMQANTMLKMQTPEIQQRTMQNFSVSVDVKDVNSLFVSFLKGVAAGAGPKRARAG
eukprot:gnl/TRDRNA2_/TRDRNA2_156902_c0_seq1.p1 gnl/TRDRNA2_/TRDRNA2_156902_c0~~gnl/TRDRNA2_/TRDRNA2_156902_c0_seq1.p1  ORF type:complete len:348 (-),score=46.74 gnl/TRDRNA2_/TRDRNA2_156902_c0_seq1:213-1256(-)